MSSFPRPTVVASRCLELEACRHDGQVIRDEFVRRLTPHVRFLPVCPELSIGLGVPRPPIHLVASAKGPRLVQPSTGRDLTEEMRVFAGRFLGGLPEVDGFLLKGRSPSCGVRDVRVHSGGGKGPGAFAARVLEGFPGAAVEEEGRLLNLRIRDHFLTRIFASARLRAVGTMGGLVRFHASHKLFLLSVDQAGMRELGKIVANHEKRPVGAVLERYGRRFREAMSKPPRAAAHVNTLMHAFGHFSDELSAAEKRQFLKTLEDYRKGRVALGAPVAVLRAWTARFDRPYLADQVFFDPYPEELVSLSDSGKGRGE